ncbi:MAG TPA: FtsX-like permease family protein [Solirubrobacterales bacterium]|nr:FtsX-like permease family protein [Solirubrobacterales bacterium]
MTGLAVKSLWARRVRALTTTLAVVIGVAFVAGTYILTDTTFAAFDEIFEDSLAKTSVVITAQEEVRQETGEVPSFSAAVLPKARGAEGVRLAVGQIFTPGAFFDEENEQIGTEFAPKFITSVLPEQLETQTYVEGRPPRDASEATLDRSAAEEAGLGIGDTLRLASVERVAAYRIVGLTQLGEASWGGASVAGLILSEAQRITDKRDEYDQILIAAADGVSEAALARDVRRAVPGSVRVETAKQNSERNSDQIRSDLGFLRIALLVFAFVALFVGAFLIFNTFSITVAQRIREFGMLRTLGAGRRQILGSVVVEALTIGVIGALLGLVGGYAIAVGLNALFVAIGIDLPTTGLVTKDRTIVASLAIGIGVTLVSSFVPALSATRVPPIAALQNLKLPRSRRRGIVNAAVAVLLGLAGLGMVLAGLFGGADGGSAAQLIGGGAVAVLLGVSLFSPRLVRPLASFAGRPLELLRRLTGRLARENTQRNPARTAVTAAALMIGLAVVAFVTVFAAGIKSSIATAVDESFQGELVLQNSDGFTPISPRAAGVARQVPGVELVSAMRATEAKLLSGNGGDLRVSALDRDAGAVVDIDWTEGDPGTLRRLGDEEVIVDKSLASGNGFEVGDEVRFLTQVGAKPRLRVVGEYEDKAELFGGAIVSQRLMASAFDQSDDVIDFVKLAPGADGTEVQARLVKAMERDFPVVEVRNQQELKENQEEQINQLLGLIYALLALAVIVSLFGIANTLALSIHERTRELGMLRAIGMSRRQVRTMIRYEAVITALIGALLGMVIGVIFAALISQPLADEGFVLSYPVGQLFAMLVFAAVCGVLAAIPPARRASRLDVLEALQYE